MLATPVVKYRRAVFIFKWKFGLKIAPFERDIASMHEFAVSPKRAAAGNLVVLACHEETHAQSATCANSEQQFQSYVCSRIHNDRRQKF
jgi:hypothetical protein